MLKAAYIMALAGAFVLTGTGAFSQCCYNEADLKGTWTSVGAEKLRDGTYGFREFRFTKKTWARTFIRYADRTRRTPLYSSTAEGTYTVNEESARVAGAFNTAFRVTRRSLTLLTEDARAVKRYGMDECGMRRGVPRDLSLKGCSIYRSVVDAPVEYELSRREKNALFLGARSEDEDLSSEERRPGALGEPLVLVTAGGGK